MATKIKLTDNLDYLRRVGFDPETLTAKLPTISASDDKLRRLVRITGVGRFNKAAAPIEKMGPDQSTSTKCRRINRIAARRVDPF